jgi:actin-related protein 6
LQETKLALIVESSFSATHIYPTFNNILLTEGVRRLDIGGKLLTKMLAKMISFKQIRMEDYFHTIGKMKEEVCYFEDNCAKALETH